MGTRKAAVAEGMPAGQADGEPPATGREAAAGGAGEVGRERDCWLAVSAAEDAVRMGDSTPREAATAAAAAATPGGANEPGVGGTLSMHCGLTGRLPRSLPLGRVDRKGPGLIGRLSVSIVKLEAACRQRESGSHLSTTCTLWTARCSNSTCTTTHR